MAAAGAQGPQGNQGAQGNTGATGPAGPTAISANANNKATLGTDSLTLVQGTAAGIPATTHAQTVSGDDPQLTNARTPTSHATTHITTGQDLIPGASPTSPGLVPARTGAAGTYLDVTGVWSAPPMSAPLLRGYLAGLTLSTAGGSTSFTTAVGVAVNSTNIDFMLLASALTKTTAAWAVGNAGSLDTGTIAASTWYHIHLIKRPDTGIVDVLTSLSPTAPTLPANYTLFRRIASMRTNASLQWTGFIQNGDQFRWMLPLQDVAAGNPGTAAVTRTLTVPTGVIVEVDIAAFVFLSSSITIYVLITSLAEPDNTADATLFNFGASVSSIIMLQLALPVRGVLTNTSAQIRTRLSASSGSDTLIINTFGWFDRRGRDG
jgi:hypothetical protein